MAQPQPAVEPFARHHWPFHAMALTRTGYEVVAACGDGTVRRWDTVTGSQLGEPIIADTDLVLLVAAAGTRHIVSGGDDGNVRWWDPKTGKMLTLPTHMRQGRVSAMAFGPDGDHLVSGDVDGDIHRWDVRKDKQISPPMHGHEGPVRAVTMSPDGRMIISCGVDGTVRRWDATTGAPVGEPLTGHQGWVYAVTVSPDGSQIISAGDDAILRWNTATGSPIGEPLTGHNGNVFAVTTTPDGTQIISGGSDGTIRRWDATTGAPVGEPLTGHQGWVRTVLVTDGGQIISCGNDGTIRRWAAATGEPVGEPITSLVVAVNAVALNEVTGEVVTASIDGAVRVWHRETGQGLGRLSGPDNWINALAIAPDGGEIICAGEEGWINRWGATTHEPLASLLGHDGAVRAVAFTPDSQVIVSGGADGTIRRWDRETANQLGEPMTGHRGPVHAVAVTPDGKRIISAGKDDGRIFRWSVRTGEAVGEWITGHDGGVLTVAVSPDGNQIVSGGGDGSIGLWNRRGQVLRGWRGHSRSVTVVRFSADGRRVVSGGADNVIRQWDAATGEPVGASLTGHEGTVTSLAIPRAGTVILSGSADGTVRAWDLDTGTQVGGGVPEVAAGVLADVLSDLEADEDRLDIAEDVQRIAAMLAALSVRPPLSVALLGDWGTGKSSFMRQLRSRMTDIAARSRTSADSAFASNLRQVTFNAWHYSDDHLWVGLIEHMFRELATVDTAADEGTAEQVAELKATLSTRKAERDRLDADLTAINRIDTERGWFAALRAPLRSARVARAALASAWRELRGWRWLALLATGIGIAGVVLSIRLGQSQLAWAGGVVAAAAGLVSPAVAAWRRLTRSTEDVRRQLLRRKDELDRDIREADDELGRIEPAHRLDRLLAEISTAERYESFRGLTGRIHHDLRRLSEDLAAARETWVRRGREGTPPLQRIVLYVDDLDRCAPQRVVDVLQAVNLLLTMDLFMVVVAVDPRWLLKALSRHHRGLLRDVGGVRQQVSPLDYLDKIFHIPFALRPMGSRAGTFLRSMLPVDEEPEQTPEPARLPAVERPATEPVADTPEPVGAADHAHTTEAAVVVRVASPPVATLNSAGLRVRQVEQDFLAGLAPLLPTPRAVKKLANLYRLVRLSIHPGQLDDFLGDREGGPYQAAALLLAALVADPRGARALLVTLTTAPPGQDITQVLPDDRLATLVKELRDSGVGVHGDTTTYRTWATAVARYGFETYDLFTEQAAKR